jgi:hypothetical protein
LPRALPSHKGIKHLCRSITDTFGIRSNAGQRWTTKLAHDFLVIDADDRYFFRYE